MRKVFIAAIFGCISFAACKSNSSNSNSNNTGKEVNSNDTLSKIQNILKSNAFIGNDNYFIHICAFDGRKMFKYTLSDLQNGYLREDKGYSGEYKVDIDGDIYITIKKGNKEVMYKLIRYTDGKYALIGDVNLTQDSPNKEEAKPTESATTEPTETSTDVTTQETEASITTSTPSNEPKTGTVLADKTYFYKEADLSTKRRGYLIKGQSVTITKKEGQFVHCIYGKTEGWMLATDIQ